MVLSIVAAFAMAGGTEVTLQGVPWLGDEASAARLAAQKNRPILSLHLLGKLSDDFC